MPVTEQIDLPEGYYLDNFRQLVSTVGERYADLLDSTDQNFLTRFRELSEPAARLLVRLYTRKGPVFRVNRLSYADVGPTEPAIAELVQAGLLDPAPPANGTGHRPLANTARSQTITLVPGSAPQQGGFA